MSATRIEEFDLWRPGYGGLDVSVYLAGTTTLATLYDNEDLTGTPLDNPQTLDQMTVDGVSYGKFADPVYVGAAYQLDIEGEQTGIVRPPLSTLDGEDASQAEVTADDGTEAFPLNEHLGRRIDVRDYGEWIIVGGPGASASTNNATLVSAMAAASAVGAGFVEVPGGTYEVTNFTIPQGVVLRGVGRTATTLQSIVAGTIATIGGLRAGFSRLTLDGVTLVGNSVGILGVAKNEIVLDDVQVMRFETGIYLKGGTRSTWINLYIENCVNGYKAHGDLASGSGSSLYNIDWYGGQVTTCTTVGVELKYIDAVSVDSTFRNVEFSNNTGTAVKIIGARSHYFRNCNWAGNTGAISIEDATPANDFNQVQEIEFTGGFITGGTMTFSGNVDDVVFKRMALSDLTITINTVRHNILAEDCREATVTIGGTTPTAWTRGQSTRVTQTFGITTGNAVTKAWAITLELGEQIFAEGKVLGRQRNGTDHAYYHFSCQAIRSPATLDYDTQTANFTLGTILTGATSGATARIVADTDAGATGTLSLQDIDGTFVDNELITDTSGGSALANGTQDTSPIVNTSAITTITPAGETDASWGATFAANGPELQVAVLGAAAKTVEWTVEVAVTRTI